MEHKDTLTCLMALARQYEKPLTAYKVSAKGGVNVRSGPGISYMVIRAEPFGKTVYVLEEYDGWGRVGDHEWMSMNFLDKVP